MGAAGRALQGQRLGGGLYNPVNEPGDAEGTTIGPFYRRLEAAIRAVDPDHILFLDGNRYSTQFDQLGDPSRPTRSGWRR